MADAGKFVIGKSPGACLKQLREEQALSIQDIASRLYLEPGIIEALEADNFEQLASATYVRGYLRSYTRLLGVPPDTVLAMYQNDFAPRPPEIIPEVQLKNQQTSSRDKPVLFFSYLVVFVLILLFLAWWQSHFVLETNQDNSLPDKAESSGQADSMPASPPNIEESEIEESEVEEPTPTSALADTMPLSAPTPVEQTDSAQTWTIENPPVAGDDAPTIPPNTEAIPQAGRDAERSDAETSPAVPGIDERGSGPDTVEIQLYADSWVEVFDHNDEKIYLNLGRAGQTLLLHGTAPFNVLIGFSQGVAIKFNGQDFDPAPFSRAGIARFSLGN